MELFIKAIILGIVEGVTEFLPVSSTGHLIIVNRFIDFTGKFATMFDIVIQLGAILSVMVYFKNRLFPIEKSIDQLRKMHIVGVWKKTIAGVSPAIVIGGAFGGFVEEKLFNPTVVAIALVVGGVVLIIVETMKKKVRFATVNDMPYRIAVAIGFFQCIAMAPGTSRSAATIIGAMLLGMSRLAAAEFSFFLAIPTMLAASAYSLLKSSLALTMTEWAVLLVGFIVSFLTAWAVIAGFMRYIQSHDFKPFGYYRVALGIIVLFWMVF